jgi:hypothetical protein
VAFARVHVRDVLVPAPVHSFPRDDPEQVALKEAPHGLVFRSEAESFVGRGSGGGSAAGGRSLGAAGTTAINGDVTDPQARALVGAKVTVTLAGTQSGRTVETDGYGHYQLQALPPGVYTIRVELTGFRSIVQSHVSRTIFVFSVTARAAEMIGRLGGGGPLAFVRVFQFFGRRRRVMETRILRRRWRKTGEETSPRTSRLNP